MAFLALLKRMERTDLTGHGFRSTFRDWVAEKTDFPNELAEMALAHTVGDKVEAAYRRGDMFERRRSLMMSWTSFATGGNANEQSDPANASGSSAPSDGASAKAHRLS